MMERNFDNDFKEEEIIRDFSQDQKINNPEIYGSKFDYPKQSGSELLKKYIEAEDGIKDNNSSNDIPEFIIKSPIFVNEDLINEEQYSLEMQEKLFKALEVNYKAGYFVDNSNFLIIYEQETKIHAKTVSLKTQKKEILKVKPQNSHSFVVLPSGYLILAEENSLILFEAHKKTHDFYLIDTFPELLGNFGECTLEIIKKEEKSVLMIIGGENEKKEPIDLIHYFDISDPLKIFFKGVTVMKTSRKHPIILNKDDFIYICGGTLKAENEAERISSNDILNFFQDEKIPTQYFKINFANKFITKKSLSYAGVVQFGLHHYLIGRNKKKILIIDEIDHQKNIIFIKYAKGLKLKKELKLCNSNVFLRKDDIFCLGLGKENIEIITKNKK